MKKKTKPDIRAPKCQADEWPPGYWLPDDKTEQEKPEWGQLVRWLPGPEKGNGQRIDTTRKAGLPYKGKPTMAVPLNSDLLELGKSRTSRTVKDGTTTHHTTYFDVGYKRAVFTLAINYEKHNVDPPKEENDWYLRENPCWPQPIVQVCCPDVPRCR